MEDFSSDAPEAVDFERVLYQALVNEGKHVKVDWYAIQQHFLISNERFLVALAKPSHTMVNS